MSACLEQWAAAVAAATGRQRTRAEAERAGQAPTRQIAEVLEHLPFNGLGLDR